jgi:low affinity Fe/Cu permease
MPTMPDKSQPKQSSSLREHQPSPSSLNQFFSHFANQTSRLSGAPSTFAIAVGIIVIWAVTGPLFKFSDTWQLVINTGTTIITFLMVFLIQNTQNRDGAALHLKIDELIRANKGARNALLDMENLTQEELDEFKEKFAALARHDRETGHNHLQNFISEVMQDSPPPSSHNHSKHSPTKQKQEN